MNVLLICGIWFVVVLVIVLLFMGVIELFEGTHDIPGFVMAAILSGGFVACGFDLYAGISLTCRVTAAYEPHFVQGVVIRRVYVPSTTTFIMSGKVMVPIVNPEHWELVVQEVGGDRTKSLSVSHSDFDSADIGAVIPAP